MVSFGCKSEIYQCIFSLLSPNLYQTGSRTLKRKISFFENLFVTKDVVVSIKKETTKQATCNKRKSLSENRITSSNTHKIFIPKKKNLESLFENEFSKKEKKILKFVQDVLKHGHRSKQMPDVNIMKLCNTK